MLDRRQGDSEFSVMSHPAYLSPYLLPVSYTHLAHPDGSLKDLTLGTALTDDDGNWMQIYDVPVYLGSHYFIPVSYTHLDVYKRQLLSCKA